MRQVLSLPGISACVSARDLYDSEIAEASLPEDRTLNVGDVLMVGAGGVGSCLACWLKWFQRSGVWRIVDGDRGELDDTNRGLGIFPVDCGWNDAAPQNKAQIAASLIDAEYETCWYDESSLEDFVPDLVLPLANE